VLTADHGESMVEHGYLFGHGQFAFQTTAHVPLVVRIPDGVGRLVHARVSQVDVFPTLADLVRLELYPTEGISLAGVIAQTAGEGRGACRLAPSAPVP
jgi:arylsulfatase A-like enzyme